MDPFGLDDAAALRLSDEQALQRRLDARNRRVLPGILWGLLFVYFSALMTSSEDFHGKGWPLAAAGLLLTVGNLLLLRLLLPTSRDDMPPPRPPRPALVARFGQLLQAVLLAEYLLGVAWTTTIAARPVPVFVIAVVLLAFRLVGGELLLLHGLTLASGLVLWWVVFPHEALRVLLGAVPLHALCAGLGLLATRRFRRQFLARWGQRVAFAREQVRVREELDLARAVQLSMLPAAMPALSWVEVGARTLPASEVGGDYYDFFPTDSSLAVVVADVAGHGVASGLVLASVRAGLALLMEDPHHELAGTMARLDGVVRRGSRRMLVTLAVAQYDRAVATLTVSTAGHPPVLVRRADGRVEEAVTPAPPLGTRLVATAVAVHLPFAAGDCSLLYTDGLVESANADGTAYGSARLQEVLAESVGLDAEALVDAILEDLARHRGEAPQEDDVTLVVMLAR